MITPAQIRAARALVGMTQAKLAEAAGITPQALIAIERGSSDPKLSTLLALRASLEAAGVEIIPEDGGGAGVRLAKPKQ